MLSLPQIINTESVCIHFNLKNQYTNCMRYYWKVWGRMLWSPTDHTVEKCSLPQAHLYPNMVIVLLVVSFCIFSISTRNPRSIRIFFFFLAKFKIKCMLRYCPCHKSTTRNTEPEWGGENRITCNLCDLHASRLEEPSKITTDRAISVPLHPELFLTCDEAQLFCSSFTKSQLKRPIKPQPVSIFMPFIRS